MLPLCCSLLHARLKTPSFASLRSEFVGCRSEVLSSAVSILARSGLFTGTTESTVENHQKLLTHAVSCACNAQIDTA